MNSQALLLARHAFMCQADNHLVFLDLRHDKYLCLDREQTLRMIGPQSPNHQRPNHQRENSCFPELPISLEQVERQVVQNLLDRGLLVEDDKVGKPATLTYVEPPLESLRVTGMTAARTNTIQDIRRFSWASTFAASHLRWRSIERTVRAVTRRKITGLDQVRHVSTASMTDLMAVFLALRPFYPRKYLCLFDSLALVRFLAYYSTYPQWVFGVKLEPFAAHCWVQDGRVVLNDSVEYVGQFTPIMAV